MSQTQPPPPPPPPPPAPPPATAPRPGPEAELALAGPYQRATPPPVPLPGGSPGWPPEQPAFGADWMDVGPGPGARKRLVIGGVVALAVVIPAVVLVVAVV